MRATSLAWMFFGCSPPPELGRVEGVVTDALVERPLAGVRVRARDHRAEARTDAEGRFVLELPAGDHMLVLDREGYVEGRRANVRLRAGETVSVDPILFPSAPRDEDVEAYFRRQPVRRHAHPAHERPPVEADPRDIGGATHALDGVPETIRVWRSNGTPLQPTSSNGWADRSCDPAAVVLELPLEEYVKGVVPHEWIPSWHPEALRAGAIAARSYAVSWAMRGGRWDCADVDDGTVTQVYRDDRAATADEAVDATAAMVVTRGGAIVTTEYSAENSDPTATGVAEPTCTGTTRNGHGRGMCQWGTHRWATSTCRYPPCDFGAFGDAPKDFAWLVEHYYPGSFIDYGEPAVPCAVIGPEGGVLDDEGPCFERYGPSQYWREVDAGHAGHLLWTNAFEASAPSNWARWRIHVASPSVFRVAVYVDPEWGVYSATRYVVSDTTGEHPVIIDQSSETGWVELGVFDFASEGSVRVEDNYEGPVAADQHIVVDAIRLLAEFSPPPSRDAGVPAADGGTRRGRVLDGNAMEAPFRGIGCVCRAGGASRRAPVGWVVPLLVLAALRRSRANSSRR